MAYTTYTTKAFVCGTYKRNTADCSYQLFTREAGMLYATARSVREERSKQRYALQDFSLVRVSLIKGKQGWRIGSVEAGQNYYQTAFDKSTRGSIVSLFRFLRRFVKGEERNTELFDYFQSVLTELIRGTQHQSFILLVAQIHILEALGYVDVKLIPTSVRKLNPSLLSDSFSEEVSGRLEAIYIQAASASHL